MTSNIHKIGTVVPSVKQMLPSWAKTPIHRLTLQYRQATWQSRVLPDFIIIGAQKSGTTSMHSYLSQHPQLLASFKKEVHFFDAGLNPRVDNFKKGEVWYRAHFPMKKNIGARQKTFEASPLYIFNPLAPKRIFNLLPEVKIIAILRNPTERAISHYFHEKQNGRESLSIYEALQREEKRLESVIKEEDYKNDAFIHHSYKSRGLYRGQLKKYLDYFPPQQILVINSGEFFAEPDNVLRRVFKFVEVDIGFKVKNLTPSNVSNNRRDVAPEVYDYLDSYFLPHNQALYGLIGEDYSW